MQQAEVSPVKTLIGARRRYVRLRQQLDLESELDRSLHHDLTAAIREIDRKIEARHGPRGEDTDAQRVTAPE